MLQNAKFCKLQFFSEDNSNFKYFVKIDIIMIILDTKSDCKVA